MKPELFAELLASANQALEFEQGKRNLKTTELPRIAEPMDAAEVRAVRTSLHASQAVFAHYLNVSPKLVQAWEGNRRTPDGPALILLRLMQAEPGLIDTLFSTKADAQDQQSPHRERRTRAAGA